jgi:GGDEF domain-containing protein
MVRRLGERVAKYNTSRPEIPLSISTGYATREGVRITLNELFRQADDNMYREKRRRKKDADHLSATHRSPVLNGA